MKNCSECNKQKSLDSFHNLSKTKDGKNYICKECDSIRRSANKKDKYSFEQIQNYISINSIIEKTCLTCSNNKVLESFPKDFRIKDGRANNCNFCYWERKKKENLSRIQKQKDSGVIDNFSFENVEKFKELFNKGNSIRKIANYFDIRADKVKEILKILDLKACERKSNKGSKLSKINNPPEYIILDGTFYIYAIINNINKKMYIGQSIDVNARWNKHLAVSRSNHNHPLYNSIRKYGKENFSIEIIDTLFNINDCNNAEIYWIDYLQTTNLENGYNIALGGEGRGVVSEETRKNLSVKMTGSGNPFFGRKHSKETREKIRIARTGSKTSEEVKQKMSDKRKGSDNGMFGKKHSQESKDKIAKTIAEKLKNDPSYGRIVSKE